MSGTGGSVTPRVTVRRSTTDPERVFFDFDLAAPGGRGGASIRFDPMTGLASVDSVHRNAVLPLRSTGGLLADGFRQVGVPQPAVIEAFNVEPRTAGVLAVGGDSSGTPIGTLLDDTATALGGTVTWWEPVRDGNCWHLRAHVSYP